MSIWHGIPAPRRRELILLEMPLKKLMTTREIADKLDARCYNEAYMDTETVYADLSQLERKKKVSRDCVLGDGRGSRIRWRKLKEL